MSLNYRVFEPEIPAPNYANTLMIVPNEIAAGVDDYHGARAKTLADRVGARVLAYERPYSASSATFSLSLRRHTTRNLQQVFASNARLLDRAVTHEGADKLIVSGHSGGATEGIGITSTQILPVADVVFTDPAAMRRVMTIKGEFYDYGYYTFVKERFKPDSAIVDTSQNYQPKFKPGGLEQARRTVDESYVYGPTWRSDIAYKGLCHIAKHQPETAAAVIFPQFTYTAPPKLMDEITSELNAARDEMPDAAPFNVTMREGLYHSAFNSYDYFAEAVADNIKS